MKLHQRFSTLSPIYDGGLTNHLPMMITALKLLDVEEQDIELIAEEYVGSKNLLDLSHSGIENDIYNDEYIRLTNFFLNEMKRIGISDTVSEVLNANSYALHSALFHGIIRLAYALLEYDELLIAQSLAYFELSKEDMKMEGTRKEDITEAFRELTEIRKNEIELSTYSSMSRFSEVMDNANIVDNMFYPYDILHNKDKVLKLFVDYYNKTHNFYILHVITGYHALHILSQYFENEEEAYNNYFMQAVVFMLLSDHQEYFTSTNQNEFSYLSNKVPYLRDAHDIKFFFSLSYFYELYEVEELKIAAQSIFNKTEEQG